jgi:hypothetical protein
MLRIFPARAGFRRSGKHIETNNTCLFYLQKNIKPWNRLWLHLNGGIPGLAY